MTFYWFPSQIELLQLLFWFTILCAVFIVLLIGSMFVFHPDVDLVPPRRPDTFSGEVTSGNPFRQKSTPRGLTGVSFGIVPRRMSRTPMNLKARRTSAIDSKPFFTENSAKLRVERYRAGEAATIRVNPIQPQKSVLRQADQ